MKKILSVILAFVLAFAVMIPCVAEDQKSVTVGAWPQSLVTGSKEIGALNTKFDALPKVVWNTDCLSDGKTVQYVDVHFKPWTALATNLPTYRAVRVGNGSVQWYRWEPLTWTAQAYRGRTVWLCTSVIFAAQDGADTILTWLQETFYQSAFTAAERETYSVYLPTYSMTEDIPSRLTAATDYAALYGADGLSFCMVDDPDESNAGHTHEHTHKPPTLSVMSDNSEAPDAQIESNLKGSPKTSAPVLKTDSSPKSAKTKSASTAKPSAAPEIDTDCGVIGVRPVLMELSNETHGLIFCFLCWIFHR